MTTRMALGCVAALLGLVQAGVAAAQVPYSPSSPAVASTPESSRTATPALDELPVYQVDLSGPRLGATFGPDGSAVSQFGWHSEHQAAPNPRGPFFLVETVVLVAGVDKNLFVPNGTLVFGMRLPNSFEFGLGPSLTLGARSSFLRSGIVFAAGQSFRLGGIRIPVNLAFAPGTHGDSRITLVTGWAIRDRPREP